MLQVIPAQPSNDIFRQKGVLLPQMALAAQCQSLVQAWRYSPNDHLLHVLPLHHIHGVVNALLAPLTAGASVELLSPFNAHAVWKRLAAPFLPSSNAKDNRPEKVTILTAVPTIYSKLLASFSELAPAVQEGAQEAISPHNLRLNMSGSAALPTPTKAAWTKISNGNVLLERYGMTEVGMALSCGLDFSERVDGSVGWPLPSVEVRLVETDTGKMIGPGEELDRTGKERDGEIQIRGPAVFKEYWRNQAATEKAFHSDASEHSTSLGHEHRQGRWFKTGDVAVRRAVREAETGKLLHPEKGAMYFIKGRRSVDIIKTGGERVSALEVERELLSL